MQDGATNISSLSYAYGDGMNLTAVNDNVTSANSAALSYSPANRLATANGAWGNASFTYDGVGNRTSDLNTVSAVTTTRLATYAATSNRITGMTENSAALRSYAYDNAGNILTDTRPGEVFAFTYNNRNRPASVTRNSVAYATYGYNAFGQLVSRSTSASGGPTGIVHYIHDLDGHIIAEADAATGATSREYIWMAAKDNTPTDLPLAVVDDVATSPVLLMVHTDHLGRPIRMTDATKATAWAASYKPWGDVQSLSGTRALNLRFPGQYFQIETNLAYNWHRHYDTTTGRYTQPDPLGFVDGPSIYAYAGNSPFMNVDRTGRGAIAYGGGIVGGLVGGIIGSAEPGGGTAAGALVGARYGYGVGRGIEIAIWMVADNPAENAKSKALADAGAKMCFPEDDDGCDKEWEEARNMCKRELDKPNPNFGLTGGHYDVQNCAKGLVSARCGGNKVELSMPVRRIFGRMGAKFKRKR